MRAAPRAVVLGTCLAVVLFPSGRAAAALGRAVPMLESVQSLSVYQPKAVRADWLLDPSPYKAGVFRKGTKELVLGNGLIARTFRIAPNGATVGLDHCGSGEAFLRSVRPEARVQIDGCRYDVGGLVGQPVHNYLLPEWLDRMKADPAAFELAGFSVGRIRERFDWKKRRQWMPADLPWPPPGATLTLSFRSASPGGVRIDVHYALYDGLPLLCKWLTVHNGSKRSVTVDAVTSEILAAVEAESQVETSGRWRLPNLHVETDYACVSTRSTDPALRVVRWGPDPRFRTQVHYRRQTPCLLEVGPTVGPGQVVAPGGTFESFRTWELLHDSWDRERQGLGVRRMYRTVAPWVTENPILMHVRSARPAAVKLAIDQCAEVGFEMVILTFGSGFNIENADPKYLAGMKELAEYAHSKGVALGGYSLLASRRVGGGNDVVSPPGRSPTFGNSPCVGSTWGRECFRKLEAFFRATGMDVLEHDGSYPGDVCASTDHPGHRGLADSQWTQFRTVAGFYRWCRGRGIYLNVPDWYYLNGSTKCGMGYRETNWSLPRKQQEIVERQNVFDGTWRKTPSMGWMFVPLVQYHGGGPAATIEPLKDHLDHYAQRLANLFGAGVQACYRGPRLYDSDETRAVVARWVAFYRKHRAILDSDIIHVRRADGRDLDCILHVNPGLETCGLAMVYNPLDRAARRTLRLPLYYTGLTRAARIREKDGPAGTYPLDADRKADVPVEVPPRGVTWLLIEAP